MRLKINAFHMAVGAQYILSVVVACCLKSLPDTIKKRTATPSRNAFLLEISYLPNILHMGKNDNNQYNDKGYSLLSHNKSEWLKLSFC